MDGRGSPGLDLDRLLQDPGSVELADACGLAPLPDTDRFLVTSGTGAVYAVNGRSQAIDTLAPPDEGGIHWDNHVSALA